MNYTSGPIQSGPSAQFTAQEQATRGLCSIQAAARGEERTEKENSELNRVSPFAFVLSGDRSHVLTIPRRRPREHLQVRASSSSSRSGSSGHGA